MNSYIKGKFKREIFRAETGYTIGLFKITETSEEYSEYKNKTITFTGYFHELNDMDNYIFYGKFTTHEKYGEQFNVENYERLMPEEKDAIVEFLTSGLFTGIGKGKAEKIVNTLKENTLDTILNNPSNLILIPGITEKNARTLHEKLVEYEESYNTIIELGNIGFTTKEAMLIYNKYRENTLDTVDKDIYNIVYNIDKISFKRIDYIAKTNNIDLDDINRIKASICYIISELSNMSGNTYYYEEEIKNYIPRVLGITLSDDEFKNAIDELVKDIRLEIVNDRIYLKEMYEDEILIASRIRLLQHEKDLKVKDIDKTLEYVENYLNIDYSENQEQAIKESITKKFLIITGGPGTGKTTITKAICELYKEINKLNYQKLNEELVLLAPTGRAAKRMSEETNMKASTIHRFLKWNKETNKFQINEYNKSKAKFILVDESSMIDNSLFASLLRGISVNTKIVLIGDVDQLPSVGPGNLLHDLIYSDKLNVCKLDYIYRQKVGSNIVSLAYGIKNGKIDYHLFNNEEDLTFIKKEPSKVMETVEEIARDYTDYSYKKFQILAPMYKGMNGIDNINNKMEDIFNKKKTTKKEIKIGEETYRENDKVLQLTNMPDDNVYNGDIGIISKINLRPKKEIYIDFDGNIVKYTPANFLNFKKAYAISIHKAQGSEFDVVIIPLVNSFKKMLYRKLIYTGVTRCKKRLIIVGDNTALDYAVDNNTVDIRRTGIKDFLINGIN